MVTVDYFQARSVFIPNGIQLPTEQERDRIAAFLAYLLDLTAQTPEARCRGHFVNIHVAKRRQLLGHHNDKALIQYCVDQGWIEYNKRYSSGERVPPFPQSFRFTKPYRSGQVQAVRLRGHYAQRGYAKAAEPNVSNLNANGMFWFDRLPSIVADPSWMQDPELQEPWTYLTLAKLTTGRHVASRCDFRRLHTLWTQASRKTRRHWRTATGEPVSQADVGACQPLCLGILAASPPEDPTRPRPLYPYVARHAKSDVQKWIELCEQRAIYPFLFEAVQQMDGPQEVHYWCQHSSQRKCKDLKHQTLGQFKRECLIPVFDRVALMLDNPVFLAIQIHFPTIAAFCIQAKSMTFTVKGRKLKHQVLACMLQRFEAETIIDDVGLYLSKNHHTEPVATVHDAVFCRSDFALQAREIIKGAFERFGVNPAVEIQHEGGPR